VPQLTGGLDSYAGGGLICFEKLRCGGALIIQKLSSDYLKQSSDFS
jgi:hypothetical protein